MLSNKVVSSGWYLTGLVYMCVLQNATQTSGSDMYVVVYNPLATLRSSVIMLPVSVDANFDVERLDGSGSSRRSGRFVKSIRSVPVAVKATKAGAPFTLVFQTGQLPPVGAAVFKVSMVMEQSVVSGGNTAVSAASSRRLLTLDDEPSSTDKADSTSVEVSNGMLTVRFDR